MLSRVATAGARGALRARLPAASAGGRARVPLIQPAFQTFHAGERGERCMFCMGWGKLVSDLDASLE